MNRASPADLRKAIDAATTLMKAGVLFVPMPVLNEADHAELIAKLDQRLDQLASESEAPCEPES